MKVSSKPEDREPHKKTQPGFPLLGTFAHLKKRTLVKTNPLDTWLFIRVSHITPFFELSLVLLTTKALRLYEFTKKNFSVIDQKLKFRERFSFLHFLQGKNAQNRPENQQN